MVFTMFGEGVLKSSIGLVAGRLLARSPGPRVAEPGSPRASGSQGVRESGSQGVNESKE